MRMKVLLGLNFDRKETLAPGWDEASVGVLTGGPNRFLDLLETQVGLAMPAQPPSPQSDGGATAALPQAVTPRDGSALTTSTKCTVPKVARMCASAA